MLRTAITRLPFEKKTNILRLQTIVWKLSSTFNSLSASRIIPQNRKLTIHGTDHSWNSKTLLFHENFSVSLTNAFSLFFLQGSWFIHEPLTPTNVLYSWQHWILKASSIPEGHLFFKAPIVKVNFSQLNFLASNWRSVPAVQAAIVSKQDTWLYVHLSLPYQCACLRQILRVTWGVTRNRVFNPNKVCWNNFHNFSGRFDQN